MTDFRAEAERFARAAEKDQPGLAAVAYALLAFGDASAYAGEWHKLDDYDDLPDQLEEDYIFEYPNGEQVKWRLSADNPATVYQFVLPGNPRVRADCNDIADECTRWRWA